MDYMFFWYWSPQDIFNFLKYAGYFVLFLFVLVILEKLHRRNGFYRRSKCSICGQPTGFKGNKRFKLIGGCMCQICAGKLNQSKNSLDNLEPDWFVNESIYGTVNDATEAIRRLNETTSN